MSELSLDRHVLASNATTWDTAWGTFGWTPALEGARASRLEEEVPWGTRTARSSDPPRLTGAVERVLDRGNLARLGRAFLPVDGRLGFSLWGAVGDEKVGSEWRVATHTVLMDREEFRALAGYPDGLLAPGGEAAPWLRRLAGELDLREPTALEPLRVRENGAARAVLETGRLEELGRLRETVLASREGDRAALADELAGVYEALAAAVAGKDLRHVAVPIDDGGAGRELLRLVWLSLPLADRVRTFYVTEQRRAERPPGHLLGLPRSEWGRYVPENAWVLGGSEPVGPVSAGRSHWAELVAAGAGSDPMEDFRVADRRATLRGWRVVAADDFLHVGEHARWRRAWTRSGPSAEAVEELARREGERPGGPRAGAVGDAVGRAVAAGACASADAPGLLARLDEGEREDAVRGAVRALREEGRPADAGFVRAHVAEAFGDRAFGDRALGDRSGEALVRGLRRFVDRESDALRALLRAEGGPAALVRAAFAGAAAGDPVAMELARLGVTGERWTPETAARTADALPLESEGGPGVAAELLLALVREGGDADSVEALARTLLDRLEPRVADDLAPELVDLEERVGAEALRRAVLLRAAVGGSRDLDDAVRALVAMGRRTAPPALEPGPWRRLVESASAPWLARSPVLEALVEAMEAGRRRPGVVGRPPGAGRAGESVDPAAASELREVASLLARRVLGRAGPGSLDDAQATALLRLVWLEGDRSTPRWLVGTRPDAAAPLLARLLVAPAPLPLQPAVRAALAEAVDTGADTRGLAPVADELRRWAPALHERAGLSGGAGESFVPLSGAGRA